MNPIRRRTIRVLGPRTADQEVIGLDVAIDEVLLVDSLHARQLTCKVPAISCPIHPPRGRSEQGVRSVKGRRGGLPEQQLATRKSTAPSLPLANHRRTICLAAMHTVLIENFLPHISNRSSKLGPRRSMTRMLCRPSWPKWYICGMPAARRHRSGCHEKHIVSFKRSARVGGGTIRTTAGQDTV